jgi:hypothetical protein
MERILAFDIGVKNLAFAVVTADGTVHALENVNLLAPVEPIRCSSPSCPHLAKYSTPIAPYCKRHLPKTHTVLPDLDKKKVPHRRLKELVKEHGLEEQVTARASTTAYRAVLHTKFALPVEQPKQEQVAALSLTAIHDALRQMIRDRAKTFQGVTRVLLENQPAFKNPQMKSVQVLLFATLREWFLSSSSALSPSFHLVHAKKKVGDAPKGDAGYAERKQKSEERVKTLFESGGLQGDAHYAHWKQAKKKSDMADALCMAKDAVDAIDQVTVADVIQE